MQEYKKASYRMEVEKPSLPAEGRQEPGAGLHEDKSQAMGIAYGAAGEVGCASDRKKCSAQFRDYHWPDDATSQQF